MEDTYGFVYENSIEQKNLQDVCAHFDQNNAGWLEIIQSMKSKFPNHEVRDVSLLSWLDRCYTLDVILKTRPKVISVLSLSVSILVPCYVLTYIENDLMAGGTNSPLVSNDLIKYNLQNEQKEIDGLLSKHGIVAFPTEFLNKVIPDVAYKNYKIGSFTYFNAFFLDQIVNRC